MRTGGVMLGAALLLASPVHGGDFNAKMSVIEPNEKQLKKLQALTPEGIAAKVIIEDDDLATVATLNTVAVYENKGGFTDPVRADNFLRAFVDKKTGMVAYQLYQELAYMSPTRNFYMVNYATEQGPATASVTEIFHRTETCLAPEYCVIRDALGVEVTESQLREIGAQYLPGASPLWRFKFRSRTGPDWEDRISPAEAGGLLLAVERYRQANGLSEQ